MARRIQYGDIDYTRPSVPQRLARLALTPSFALLTRVRVQGLERVPRSGPLIVASNHLNLFDVVLAFHVLPRRAVVLAKRRWRRIPPMGPAATWVGDAIYTGAGDLRFLGEAMAVLGAGGAIGLAPEGRRSRSGGLITANSGVAMLATRSGAPVLPMAMYGLEGVGRSWRRLRRAPVQVCFGELLRLPAGRADRKELELHTERIMLSLAALLPPRYRGAYADRSGDG